MYLHATRSLSLSLLKTISSKSQKFSLQQIANDGPKHSDCLENFDLNAWTSDASTTCLVGKSPFLALDAFIEAIASNGNVPGNALVKQHCFYSMKILLRTSVLFLVFLTSFLGFAGLVFFFFFLLPLFS